ncbi:MAG TPA: glucoamylase family protein, partial [Gemmataceae bacterium]|nr:glucoamylase family protein [Gemmataceae bacterium]
LRGARDRFTLIVGDTTVLAGVRYVITLDTDTELPRDAAQQMAGTMAHILNRPAYDPARRRIVSGYGILQPRVGVSLPSSRRSWFVRLFGGDPGVDPYTRVVSDVYQDLFGEGSFIGKGIYDVHAFEQCCGDFPENAVLSHDLLESAYVRSALLSDVELFEEYPSRYPADVSRRHRWIRGDWQIASWLLPWVPGTGGRRLKNPISALSWWKIFDNLRRSLLPVAMLALLLGSWLLEPALGAGATLFVLIVVGAVPLLGGLEELLRKPADLPLLAHVRVTAATLAKQLAQSLFSLIFLPYEAFISADAIVRTLARMLWTKKKLLEWKTSSDAHRGARTDLRGFYLSMWIGPAMAVLVLPLVALHADLLLITGPLIGMWFLSPVFGWWLSRPLGEAPDRLSNMQRVFLGKLSRKTWRFFEVFVTAEENWLPPDNFQEHPARLIASRTSPTNIGLALLANLAAYDFGYCSAGCLIDRTQKTFATLGRMEQYRRHFYNWYDTRTLKPLTPLYVSTVDSGNMVGHLLVLRGGLLELVETQVPAPRLFNGLRDTIRVLLDVARGLHQAEKKDRIPLVPADVLLRIERLEGELRDRSYNLGTATVMLANLAAGAAAIKAAAGADEELQWWAGTFERACAEQRDGLVQLTPWTTLPPAPAEAWRQGSQEQMARLTELHALLARLEDGPTLRDLAALEQSALPALDMILANLSDPKNAAQDGPAGAWFQQLRAALAVSSQRAVARIKAVEQLARQCQELADMDFAFLFNKAHDLFAIGYNVSDHRLDGSFYDLLASEARLASFLTIAQGQFGQEHWFALGRMVTTTGGAATLLSWSGSMFEYLMPLLVMPTYESTLLDQTYKAVVRRQINYGRQRGVPWGISESGFNTVDLHLNYQYRAFGVPGLGLKRGLAEDLVIAPYASALGLMVAPEAACRNLERLTAEGQEGAYGMYEAVDYTPARVPRGTTSVTVRQFMSHHQGMSLLALAYLLLEKPMQRRFTADPMMRAADLLLQERVPKACVPIYPHVAEADATRLSAAVEEGTMRVYTDPNGAAPEVHLLSNGRYHVVITSAGGGYSRWRDLAVTRWREDATRDCWGSFCYLRDLESGVLWSTAWQPTLKPGRRHQAIFTQARAEFRRRDEKIDTHTEISVSPEDDVELRRITMTNRSDTPRTIEVTSYAEVVLALPSHDLSHPAFSNLFVQTELVRHRQAIFCTRRPRSAEERPPWLMHLATVQGTTVGAASFETDRMKFVGRGRTLAAPAAMDGKGPLSGSAGPVLDPVVSIRLVVRLQPRESVRVDLVTGVAETREAVTALTEKYHDPRLADRVFELAWTHSQILLRQLNATEADAQAYGRLAGSVIYASSLRRAKASI